MKNILYQDKKAKSKSFFLKKNHNLFDKRLLNFLVKNYSKFKKDIRICMHENPQANHHDMIILQQKNLAYGHTHKLKKVLTRTGIR